MVALHAGQKGGNVGNGFGCDENRNGNRTLLMAIAVTGKYRSRCRRSSNSSSSSRRSRN